MKTLTLLLIVAAFAFSCQKEEMIKPENTQDAVISKYLILNDYVLRNRIAYLDTVGIISQGDASASLYAELRESIETFETPEYTMKYWLGYCPSPCANQPIDRFFFAWAERAGYIEKTGADSTYNELISDIQGM